MYCVGVICYDSTAPSNKLLSRIVPGKQSVWTITYSNCAYYNKFTITVSTLGHKLQSDSQVCSAIPLLPVLQGPPVLCIPPLL